MTTFTDPPDAPDAPGDAPSRNQTQSVFTANFNAAFAWMIEELYTWIGSFNTWYTTSFKPQLATFLGDASRMAGSTLGYTFSTTTTDSDPGAGTLRLNNATQNAATVLRIDLADIDGVDVSSLLATFGSGRLRLQHRTDATKWLLFDATAVASPSGYRNITVAIAAYSAASPLANGDPVAVSFAPTGPQGIPGTFTGTAAATVELLTGSNIASASTVNLDTATGNRVHITGTTTITAVTLTRGPRTVIFDGILTLTHHATNNNLPGGANITTAAGDRAIYESDGTSVYCVAYIKANGQPVAGAGVGDHCISLHTGNGHGSTNNKIRRYTTALINVGTAMTYADSAANGASITINEPGMYAISSTDVTVNTGLYTAGASVNSAQLTTSIEAISVANRLMWGASGGSPYPGSASCVVKLAASDVVRPHGDGNPSDTSNKVTFTIRKVGT